MAVTAAAPKRHWEEVAKEKRDALAASFPKEWVVPAELLPPESQISVLDWPETSGWFTKEEQSIVDHSLQELTAKLAKGELSSVEVTKAYCKRAVAAHQLVNCLTETFFDRALERAKACDDHLAKTGTPLGPFHGLPISLKDNFNVKGYDTTLGLVDFINDPAAESSTLVTLLESLGAVHYVKTNVPLSMMLTETVNNVFGRTVNPRDRRLSPGGSSGGESSLILLKGSPIGVGSDIAGSLRIPAASCGQYSLRPSTGRFPSRNSRTAMAGQEAVLGVNGPIARTLSDLEMYSKAVVSAEPWLYDPKCLPIPWRSIELPPKLKIAILWDEGLFRPTPPITRAMKETKAKLEAAGHEVVDWDASDHKDGFTTMLYLLGGDGFESIRRPIQRAGEPWIPQMKAWENLPCPSTFETWQLHNKKNIFQGQYQDRWRAAGIDAVLCPVMPFVTAKHGESKHLAYTGLYNMLDYSCMSFPTGFTVDKEVDKLDPSLEPLSPTCKTVSSEYDPELLHGLTINLQLVAQRLQEEKVVAMTKTILEALS